MQMMHTLVLKDRDIRNTFENLLLIDKPGIPNDVESWRPYSVVSAVRRGGGRRVCVVRGTGCDGTWQNMGGARHSPQLRVNVAGCD